MSSLISLAPSTFSCSHFNVSVAISFPRLDFDGLYTLKGCVYNSQRNKLFRAFSGKVYRCYLPFYINIFYALEAVAGVERKVKSSRLANKENE